MSTLPAKIFACAPATERGRPIHLSIDPKGEKVVYASGRGIYIRSLTDPTDTFQYLGHHAATTTARFAPSGYYVASADTTGTVRIWDTVGEEHILKQEIRALSGRVNDVAWDSESQRIIAVGEGKEKFGAVFTYDTGNTAGEISGHSKAINAVDIRPSGRPFRAATGSEDGTVNFFHGAPYKFAHSIRDHGRFVHTVRYSPDGAIFVTGGADAKLFLYDGKTGEKVGELAENGHTGSIMGVAWSPDGKRLVSASADRTVKIWDVEARKVGHSHAFGEGTLAQQMGCVWGSQGHIVSLALDGSLAYLDERDASGPTRTVQGHQVAITALAPPRGKDASFYTGSYDGRVLVWDEGKGEAAQVEGKGGNITQVTGISLLPGGKGAYTTGLDDRLCHIPDGGSSFTDEAKGLGTTPLAMAVEESGSVAVTVGPNGVLVTPLGKSEGKVIPLPASTTGLSVALARTGGVGAVGAEDGHVYILGGIAVGGGEVKQTLEGPRSPVTAAAFSPDGKYLAVGSATGKIILYEGQGGEWVLKTSRWAFHTAKVLTIAWSEDGKHAVSGGLDTNVYIWSVERLMKKVLITAAHQDGVTGVGVIGESDNRRVLTVGRDACIKKWSVLAWP